MNLLTYFSGNGSGVFPTEKPFKFTCEIADFHKATTHSNVKYRLESMTRCINHHPGS